MLSAFKVWKNVVDCGFDVRGVGVFKRPVRLLLRLAVLSGAGISPHCLAESAAPNDGHVLIEQGHPIKHVGVGRDLYALPHQGDPVRFGGSVESLAVGSPIRVSATSQRNDGNGEVDHGDIVENPGDHSGDPKGIIFSIAAIAASAGVMFAVFGLARQSLRAGHHRPAIAPMYGHSRNFAFKYKHKWLDVQFPLRGTKTRWYRHCPITIVGTAGERYAPGA